MAYSIGGKIYTENAMLDEVTSAVKVILDSIVLKNEKKGGLFPLPTFPVIIKLQPTNSQSMAPSCPPVHKPHKHPVLINKFLSITLCLAEFFLH